MWIVTNTKANCNLASTLGCLRYMDSYMDIQYTLQHPPTPTPPPPGPSRTQYDIFHVFTLMKFPEMKFLFPCPPLNPPPHPREMEMFMKRQQAYSQKSLNSSGHTLASNNFIFNNNNNKNLSLSQNYAYKLVYVLPQSYEALKRNVHCCSMTFDQIQL